MEMYRAYQETLDSGAVRVTLTGPGCSAAIVPGAGFNLASWIVDGRQLMMSTQDTAAGSFTHGTPILFPLPNRTRGAMFSFGDRQIHLLKNRILRMVHGLVYDEPFCHRFWADDTGAYCEGSVEFSHGGALCAAYPFPCRLTLTYSLHAGGILLTAVVENLGDGPMPFGFAIHPYFSKMGDDTRVFLQLPAETYFETTADQLPTGRLIEVSGAEDLREAVPLSQLSLDHLYHGMDSQKTCVIRWDEWGRSLSINADDDFVNTVVYTPKTRPGFCVEPQTCATDAANLHHRGLHKESGLIILPAGESWRGSIRLTLSENDR